MPLLTKSMSRSPIYIINMYKPERLRAAAHLHKACAAELQALGAHLKEHDKKEEEKRIMRSK